MAYFLLKVLIITEESCKTEYKANHLECRQILEGDAMQVVQVIAMHS